MSRDRKRRGRGHDDDESDNDKTLLGEQKSQVFSGKAGMMAIPSSVEAGRKVDAGKAEAPKSARASWKSPRKKEPRAARSQRPGR